MVSNTARDCRTQLIKSTICLGRHLPPVPLLPEPFNGLNLTLCPATEQLGSDGSFFYQELTSQAHNKAGRSLSQALHAVLHGASPSQALHAVLCGALCSAGWWDLRMLERAPQNSDPALEIQAFLFLSENCDLLHSNQKCHAY